MRTTLLFVAFSLNLSPATLHASQAERLLILPFENLTGQEEMDGLAEGSADLLTACLSHLSAHLEVVERNAFDQLLQEHELDSKGLLTNDVGRNSLTLSSATVLVRGNLGTMAGKLAISVSLHDINTTQVLFSADVQGAPSDAVDLICDGIGPQIAQGLFRERASGSQLTSDSDPFRTQLLMAGIGHFYNENYAKAFPAFMKLLSRDGGDADARFWLAQSFYKAGLLSFAEHEFREFLAHFPHDRNRRRALSVLSEIESTSPN